METPTQVQVEGIIILGIATVETMIHITMHLKRNLKSIKKAVARKVAVEEVKDNKSTQIEYFLFC